MRLRGARKGRPLSLLLIEVATGGKQTSFCSAAEHEEVERLIGGR